MRRPVHPKYKLKPYRYRTETTKNMMKKLLLLLSGLLLPLLCQAGPVTPERARDIASAYLQTSPLRSAPQADLQLTHTAYTDAALRSASVSVAYYVFNRGADQGFVVVSGDDRLYDVLAYAPTGHLDMATLPDNAAAWLSYLQKQASLLPPEEAAELRAVEPKGEVVVDALLDKKQIRWGQDEPFNHYAPRHYPSGCVATAMGQIMKYYQWPKQSTGGRISYTDPDGNKVTANLDRTYDWRNLPANVDKGYSDEEGKALGVFLFNIGAAIEMHYTANGSGAYSNRVGNAAVQYFSYHPQMQYCHRPLYSQEEWYQLVKDELDAGHPVFYAGNLELEPGHAFVCDGYTSDNFFHFNWGWKGLANGFYRLDALVPSDISIGGGMGFYSDSQEIYINFIPNNQEPSSEYRVDLASVVLEAGYDASQNLVSGVVELMNFYAQTMKADLQCRLTNQATGDQTVVAEVPAVEIPENKYPNIPFSVAANELAPGDYALEIYFRPDDGSEYIRTRRYSNYPYNVTIHVTQDGAVQVDGMEDLPQLEYVPGSIEARLRAGKYSTLTLSLRNTGKTDFHNVVRLIPDGNRSFFKTPQGVLVPHIPAGQTQQITFQLDELALETGTHTFTLEYSYRPKQPVAYSPQEKKIIDLGQEGSLMVFNPTSVAQPIGNEQPQVRLLPENRAQITLPQGTASVRLYTLSGGLAAVHPAAPFATTLTVPLPRLNQPLLIVCLDAAGTPLTSYKVYPNR